MTTIDARKALAAGPLPEPFLCSLWRCTAPWRGCAHACLYCDGRAEKYHVEGGFSADLVLRGNLPGLIREELGRGGGIREFGAVCMGSGVTDVYQPAEATAGVSRAALEALSTSGLPLVLLTKGILAERDFDIMATFPQVLVIATITCMDPDLAAFLEPGAPPPRERLDMLARAKEAGFHAGIMAMPLCPGLSAEEGSARALFEAAAGAGLDFVEPGGLTLRPGCQKEHFLEGLGQFRPDLLPMYRDLYVRNRPSGMPDGPAAAHGGEWRRWLHELGLPSIIPWSVYRHLLSRADSLFVLMCHMEDLYRGRGGELDRLRQARGRYGTWLREKRTGLRRKRLASVPLDPFPVTRIIDDSLLAMLEAPGAPDFAALIGNDRLAALARRLVIEGEDFSYLI